MWRKYFKLVKLVPGKVIVQGYGTLDFSGDVPVETCKALFEKGVRFLEITKEGESELYGRVNPESEIGNRKTEDRSPEKDEPIPLLKKKRIYNKK
jgi:hypothetical protein